MIFYLLDDKTDFDQINISSPTNPDATISGRRTRTITIECDDEMGDKIMSYLRVLANSDV